MAYHWAVFHKDGIMLTKGNVFESEQAAYLEANRLNDTNTSMPGYYIVNTVYDPFETLEEVDELLGYYNSVKTQDI